MQRYAQIVLAFILVTTAGVTLGYSLSLVTHRIPTTVTVVVAGGGPIHGYWSNGTLISSLDFGLVRQGDSNNITFNIKNDNLTLSSSIGWQSNIASASNGTISDSLTYRACSGSTCNPQDVEGYTLPPGQQIQAAYSISVGLNATIRQYSWTLTLGRP